MKSGFAIAPKVAHARHHQRKDRREQRLQVIADKEIFLARLADYRRGIDRVATVRDRVAMKDRIVMLKRIVPVVIAERTFRPSLARRRVANQSELSFRNQSMRVTDRIPRHAQFLSA